MKKLLLKLFINISICDISWNPYNGGESYSFGIYLLGLGGIGFNYLFSFQIEKFYQWKKPKIHLQILYINILKPKY